MPLRYYVIIISVMNRKILIILRLVVLLVPIILYTKVSAITNPSSRLLASLSLSGGVSLNEPFNPESDSYTATVNSDSVTITAIPADSTSAVTGAGVKTLQYGINPTMDIVVTVANGNTHVYNLTITRPDNRSDNNNLASLSISPGNLSFSPENTVYGVTLDQSISKVSLEATLSDQKAKFVEGYGTPRIVDNLKYGNNAVIFKVQAENEIVRTYTVNVNRNDGRSTNNYLSSLTTSTGYISFVKDTLEYGITVGNGTQSVEVAAISEDKKAKISSTGGNNLIIGENLINILVTAENGAERNYIITVNKLKKGEALSSNNYLSAIDIGKYSIPLNKKTTKYTLIVDGSSAMKTTLTTEDPEATAAVVDNAKPVMAGSTVKINVIAQNGARREYVIQIRKRISIAVLAVGICVILLSFIGVVVIVLKHKRKKNISEKVSTETVLVGDSSNEESTDNTYMAVSENLVLKSNQENTTHPDSEQ